MATLVKCLAINMECSIYYSYTADPCNTCTVVDMQITTPNVTITSINGYGGSFYHTRNIKVLFIESQLMHFMPQGIEKLLPQLTELKISDSKLKSIKQSDLKPFIGVKKLEISGSDFETLDSDLFESSKAITDLNLSRNKKLKLIPSHILAPLKNLEYVSFAKCNCINKEARGTIEISELAAKFEDKCVKNWYNSVRFWFNDLF